MALFHLARRRIHLMVSAPPSLAAVPAPLPGRGHRLMMSDHTQQRPLQYANLCHSQSAARQRCIAKTALCSTSKSVVLRYSNESGVLNLISSQISLHQRDTVAQSIRSFSSASSPPVASSQHSSPGQLSPKIRAHHILAMKTGAVFAMPVDMTVSQAISNMVIHRITCALAMNAENEVEGIFTARDLMRFLHYGQQVRFKSAAAPGQDSQAQGQASAVAGTTSSAPPASTTASFSSSSLQSIEKMTEALARPISHLITRREKMVYCSPTDTARRCREMMFQLKIRNIPVLDQGVVVGIINIKDLADSNFTFEDSGGKKGFINNVTGRMGLPEKTKVKNYFGTQNGYVLLSTSAAGGTPRSGGGTEAELVALEALDGDLQSGTTDSEGGSLDETRKVIVPRQRVEMASYALPHPFKDENNVAENWRGYGARGLCMDNLLNADAFFMTVVPVWNSATVRSQAYACVADGVGSWRQFGIDPRDFAHRLTQNVKRIIESNRSSNSTPVGTQEPAGSGPDSWRAEVTSPAECSLSTFDSAASNFKPTEREHEAIHPLDAILEAWNTTLAAHVIGSTTVCVATVDSSLGQLSYSNLGDCGLMVIRNIGLSAGTAGLSKLKDAAPSSSSQGGRSTSDHLRIVYLSQQQLKSFNLPYQLGYSGSVQYGGAFETPLDADTASIPVIPGDIVLLATDGLFDNLDLNEIVSEVHDWEKKWFTVGSNELCLAHPGGVQPVSDLARRLVDRAREASVDRKKDSPFAILAKENDILWSGGMPDDTTVVVMRIVQ